MHTYIHPHVYIRTYVHVCTCPSLQKWHFKCACVHNAYMYSHMYCTYVRTYVCTVCTYLRICMYLYVHLLHISCAYCMRTCIHYIFWVPLTVCVYCIHTCRGSKLQSVHAVWFVLQVDVGGLTPLMYACASSLEESIKYLLKKKVCIACIRTYSTYILVCILRTYVFSIAM